jgi:hypothetical protein
VQQNYLESNLDERPFMEPAMRGVGVARAIGYKADVKIKGRITMKKLGIVLASLIAISFIAPTLAEAGEMHRDRHVDRHHHDDHHKKHSLIKKLLH